MTMKSSKQTSSQVLPIIALLCSVTGFAVSAFAVSPGPVDVGASVTSYQVGRLSEKASGEASTLGMNFYHLYLQGNLGINNSVTFSPNLRYMPASILPNKTPDDGATISLTTLSLPILAQVTSPLYLGGGLSLLRYEIDGKGGTKELNNGSGSSTFGLPGRHVSTTTLALDAVAQVRWQELLVGFDILLQGLGNAEKRSLSLSLVTAYNFGAR